MQQNHKPFVVVTGATGRLGYHVVHELLSQNFDVRIVCRSISKAKSLFFDIFDQIEVLECDFLLEIQRRNFAIFSSCLQKSRNNAPVTQVVSIAGSSGFIDRKITETLDFKAHKCLIDEAKNVPTIEKFIYVSSMAITRPWSMVSVVLNLLIRNVMAWKLETENYLRTSGLNFVIVRPGGLLKEKESKATAITVSQGDKDGGMVERNSVAKVITAVCKDQNIRTKVTFEVFSKKEQLKNAFEWHTPNLVQDENIVIKNKHFRTRKIILFMFWVMGAGIGSYIFRKRLATVIESIRSRVSHK